MYIVHWNEQDGRSRYGFIKARSKDEAYNFTILKLNRCCLITAIFKASPMQLTSRSICLNFRNPEEYQMI